MRYQKKNFTNSLIKAVLIAFKAHKGQRDKGGKPYILHPLNVALKVHGKDARIVALLHDVIEDSNIKIEDLYKVFDVHICEAVACITKKDGISYDDYIKRVKSNELARIVKISDMRHNSNLNRLKTISSRDIIRKNKYLDAIEFLQA